MPSTTSQPMFVDAAFRVLAGEGRDVLRRSLPAGSVASEAKRARRTFYDTFETVEAFVDVLATTLVDARPLPEALVGDDGSLPAALDRRDLIGLAQGLQDGRGPALVLVLLGGNVLDGALDTATERCERLLREVAGTAGWVTRPGRTWNGAARELASAVLVAELIEDERDLPELVLGTLFANSRPGYLPASTVTRADLQRDLVAGAATADVLRRSRNLRQHVLTLAAGALDEGGWRAFSVHDVAMRAGVPGGVVDRLFGGLDGLLAEVLSFELAGLVVEVESLHVAGHGVPVSRIEQSLDLLTTWFGPHPELINVLRHIGGGAVAQAPIQIGEGRVTLASLLQGAVAQVVDEGVAGPCAAMLVEVHLVGVQAGGSGLENGAVAQLLAGFR